MNSSARACSISAVQPAVCREKQPKLEQQTKAEKCLAPCLSSSHQENAPVYANSGTSRCFHWCKAACGSARSSSSVLPKAW